MIGTLFVNMKKLITTCKVRFFPLDVILFTLNARTNKPIWLHTHYLCISQTDTEAYLSVHKIISGCHLLHVGDNYPPSKEVHSFLQVNRIIAKLFLARFMGLGSQ